ncbi:MAG: methyltransferase domain-containing protein [Planctomycetes bacterium]|nr:methyltransferase domain-containing protein [Planctomycetota bacterium]
MTKHIDARAMAARTYDAAADSFDHPANTFWERFGRRTVERLALADGARVLDACCGTGASAIPAAERVGADGHVLGVDVSEGLLGLARAKAAQRGLRHAQFRAADVMELDLPDASFDAVVCVFGIFFVPDMQAAVKELWRKVKPGGKLAITTWGPNVFAPLNTFFWDNVRAVRPDLHRAFNCWDGLTDPGAVRELLSVCGVEPHVEPELARHPLRSPDDAWALLQGTGYRGTLEQLDPAARNQIRDACLRFVRVSNVDSVTADVIYAVATKDVRQAS